MNRSTLDRILAVAATVIVGAAVATAIIQNPPSLQRNRAIDEQRSSDLASAENRVSYYYSAKEHLPDNLATLCEQCAKDYKDPETGASYGYEKTSETQYRLCADFATDNRDDPRALASLSYMTDFRHAAGRKCFDLTVGKKQTAN